MSLFPELDEKDFIYMAKSNTGKDFENRIVGHLKEKYPNHDVKTQYHAGTRPRVNKKIRVDILFNHDIIVSAKYQEVNGTAEEKLIQEKGTLQYLCDKGQYKKAYIVYGGPKFTLIEYYQCDEMKKYFKDPYPDVEIISFEKFKELNIV